MYGRGASIALLWANEGLGNCMVDSESTIHANLRIEIPGVLPKPSPGGAAGPLVGCRGSQSHRGVSTQADVRHSFLTTDTEKAADTCC